MYYYSNMKKDSKWLKNNYALAFYLSSLDYKDKVNIYTNTYILPSQFFLKDMRSAHYEILHQQKKLLAVSPLLNKDQFLAPKKEFNNI